MTDKEIAEAYRVAAEYLRREGYKTADNLEAKADELDPPKPAPGTVVWWRAKEDIGWDIAIVTSDPEGIVGDFGFRRFNDIEYKPARLLSPDEVAVKVPPVREWPVGALGLDVTYYFSSPGHFVTQ